MDIGRKFQKEEISPAAARGEGDAPAQNNVAVSPEQPTALACRSSWARAAPWVALAVPLVVELAALLYHESQEWGFLGDLWLVFAMAGLGLGIAVWLTTWTLLSPWSLAARGMYLVVGLGSLAAIVAPAIPWWQEWDLVVGLAAVVIGVGLPLVPFWRRGWRIRIAPEHHVQTLHTAPHWLQFSIADMLLSTTGMAAILALMLIGGTPDRGELVIIGTQVVGGAGVILIGLTWRRFWVAVGTCFLLVALVCAVGMAIVEPASLFELSPLLMVATYAGPAMASALVAIGIARTAGQRLTPD